MHQELEVGILVLLRNSAKDGRKGDKLAKRWLGPYIIEECRKRSVSTVKPCNRSNPPKSL